MINKPVLLIVGMGSGVSRGVAERFGRAGFRVAMIARTEAKLLSYEEDYLKLGIEAKAFPADASDEFSLIRAITEIQRRWGMIDVALYNAVEFRRSTILDSIAAFLADYRVNVLGAITMTQRVTPQMKANKKGTLLFTGGGLVHYPMPTLLSLGMGKAATLNLVKGLVGEFEKDGIRVGTVTICGLVADDTPFSPAICGEAFYQLYLQKPGEPNEIVLGSAAP